MRLHQAENRVARRPVIGVLIGVVVVVIGSAIWVGVSMSRQIADLAPADWSERNPRPEPDISGIERYLFDYESDVIEPGRGGQTVLDRYGWVDRQRRIVRIPVERAIDLYVGRAQELETE